jgi:hypothetical protein
MAAGWRHDGVGQRRPCVWRRPAANDGVAACGRPAAVGWCQAAAATAGWRPASAAWRQAVACRRAWSASSGGLGISASDDVFFPNRCVCVLSVQGVLALLMVMFSVIRC